MALEKFEYPHTGGVTNSWLPTRNPYYDGRREKREMGVTVGQSMGKKVYLYEEGISCHYHTFNSDAGTVLDEDILPRIEREMIRLTGKSPEVTINS